MSSKDFLSPSHEMPPLKDLPDDILVLIGRVIVKHSYLELVLSRICYLLAGVEPVVGRVAIREPRTSERFAMIEDLARIKDFKIDEDALKLLRRDLPKIAAIRDAYAHGIYFEHPTTGAHTIRITSGAWQPPGMTKGNIKRKLNPPTELIDRKNLSDIVDLIDAVTGILEVIFTEIDQTFPAQP